MSDRSRIINNPSAKKLLEQIEAFDSFEALYRLIPCSRRLCPKLESVFENFAELKKQAAILAIPDQFNEKFSIHGWIAFDSMNLDTMRQAIECYESNGLEAAEELLALHYDADTLHWGVQRFKGHKEFRRRIRLVNLAKDDYLAERYHACIPLLLSLIDGLVNDVSKHVGFFADNVELTAWDCIAAHETGLQSLTSLMNKGRNRTNEESITIPYRNGILHGRDLAFDNRIVAAKCWSALFAVRDWAAAISQNRKQSEEDKPHSWKQLFSQLSENEKQRRLLEKWQPRSADDFPYLPHSGNLGLLPEATPEWAVAKFLGDWCNRRYGLLAESLYYVTDTSKGKKAGLAKQDFGRNVPSTYRILSVDDESAAVSQVVVEILFEKGEEKIFRELSVRTVCQDEDNNSVIRSENSRGWKIIQNSFTSVLYTVDL